jgi:hypothetical protein
VHRGAETAQQRELGPALGAAVYVRLHPLPLGRRQPFVQQVGKQIANFAIRTVSHRAAP